MGHTRVNRNQASYQQRQTPENWGPRSLVEERDACGVGFVADQKGRASHTLVQQALGALSCMEHRGGRCADQDSGDGAGIMTAMPWAVFQPWATAAGLGNLSPETTGVAMVFLPQNEAAATIARTLFETVVTDAGLKVLGWRQVPSSLRCWGCRP
jgi:glutamate synthase (ferredoxin)